jgi:hypothetical protein
MRSRLRSPKVARLAPDARGGVWIEYGEPRLGVGRLSGTVIANYDHLNSALPYHTVEFAAPEPPDSGLPGDQVWFATVDGLTRLDLLAFTWTHYGRQHDPSSDAARFLGLDAMFSKAILGIRDVACSPGAVWIATGPRVYRYDGSEFTPMRTDFVAGLSKLRYARLMPAGGVVWAALRDKDSDRIKTVAVLGDAGTWARYEITRMKLLESEFTRLFPFPGGAVAAAPEWGTRVLFLPSDGGPPSVRDLAVPPR